MLGREETCSVMVTVWDAVGLIYILIIKQIQRNLINGSMKDRVTDRRLVREIVYIKLLKRLLSYIQC